MTLNYFTSINRLLQATSTPRLGLERMQLLLDKLGNPEKRVRALHVAGTNGKGSTCAFLESMLRCGGYKTGTYTSPHFLCARERIKINNELISEEDFARFESLVDAASVEIADQPTFFESMTAMAFVAFDALGVDYAVIEVGLGGRLDATNVCSPIVCGITRIDLDHTDRLGDTIAKIAREKAGIIKPGVPVVTCSQDPQAEIVVLETAAYNNSPHIISLSPSGRGQGEGDISSLTLGLYGAHQAQNAAVATGMLDACGLVTDPKIRAYGLAKTQWAGRYEIVQNQEPMVLLDGAHNPAGLNQLLLSIQSDDRFNKKRIIAIVGMSTGHSALDYATTWTKVGSLPFATIATQSLSPRAQTAETIGAEFNQAGFTSVQIESQVTTAIEKAIVIARDIGGFILVTGSLYTVGQVRSLFYSMPQDSELPYF